MRSRSPLILSLTTQYVSLGKLKRKGICRDVMNDTALCRRMLPTNPTSNEARLIKCKSPGAIWPATKNEGSLEVPNTPVQTFDLGDNHGLRCHPVRVVGRQI